jgi:hypothetical protein
MLLGWGTALSKRSREVVRCFDAVVCMHVYVLDKSIVVSTLTSAR